LVASPLASVRCPSYFSNDGTHDYTTGNYWSVALDKSADDAWICMNSGCKRLWFGVCPPTEDTQTYPPFYQFEISAFNLDRMEVFTSTDPELMCNLTTVKLAGAVSGWKSTDSVVAFSRYERYRGMDGVVGDTSISGPAMRLVRRSGYGLEYVLFSVDGREMDSREFVGVCDRRMPT